MPVTKTKIRILDCYKEAFNDKESDVYLIWGGRDKGASVMIAQRMVIDMVEEPYYRAALIRKTYESIRDSQYQTIKDVVEDTGLSSMFTFLKSPLEIICNHNGNKILARGCDNAAKIKSMRDINCIHIEEADQLNEDDYVTVHTTLRHETARIREWLSFNSDFQGDYKDHFIWRYYLSQIPDTYQTGMYKTVIEVPLPNGDSEYEELRFYSHHGTYKQNPYCTPKRKAMYEALKDQSEYYYKVYTLGMLGKKENDNPWLWALDKVNHYTDKVYQPNMNYPIILSFDFNHDPCALVVGQYEHHKGTFSVIAYLKASSGDQSALRQLCDRVGIEFPHHYRTKQMIVTGDASGKQRDPSRPSNLNRYTDICGYLGLGRNSVAIARANCSHKLSRDICNDVMQLPKGAFMFYGGKGCEMLLDEIESTYPDDKESLNKAKKELGLHGLDAWRYLVYYFMVLQPKLSDPKQYKSYLQGLAIRLKQKVLN